MVVQTRAAARRREEKKARRLEAKTKFEEKARTRKNSDPISTWNGQEPCADDNCWKLDDFQLLKTLGKGGSGVVAKARDISSGHVVALKLVFVSTPWEAVCCQNEIAINETVQHAGIVKMYGYFAVRTEPAWSDDKGSAADESDDNKSHDGKSDDKESTADLVDGGEPRMMVRVVMILEYCPNGTLHSLSDQEGRLQEKDAAKYASEVIDVLSYLHSKEIIHRDIKFANILLTEDGHVKIADFGVSAENNNRRATMLGTPFYMAPEMRMSGDDRCFFYDDKVDVWALGVLLFSMVVGGNAGPYPLKTWTMENINTGEGMLPENLPELPLPSFVSKDAVDFIQKLLRENPSERLPLKDAQNHPWITNNMA